MQGPGPSPAADTLARCRQLMTRLLRRRSRRHLSDTASKGSAVKCHSMGSGAGVSLESHLPPGLGTGSVTRVCSAEEPGSLTQREGNQVARPPSWSAAVRAATGLSGHCLEEERACPTPSRPLLCHLRGTTSHTIGSSRATVSVILAMYPGPGCSHTLRGFRYGCQKVKQTSSLTTRHTPGTDGPACGGKVWGGRRQEL